MKAVVTDYQFPSVDNERRVFAAAGVQMASAQCRTAPEVIAVARDAEALLVHWAPITQEVLQALPRCKIIVRYGIGLDNIDLAAAAARGIAVCNVPDYASGEVADHTLGLALALARQIPLIDARLRRGEWKITADHPLPSFRDMTFVTLGYGKIARETLHRARAFGFRLAAHDPFVDEATLRADGVSPVGREEAIATADILSLHLPLSAATRHLLNADSLRRMMRTAIVINSSRGGLIDTLALARALEAGEIFAAGLDVFEEEPLPPKHPIRRAPRTLLTSHLAWYSNASAPRLQQMAAEEIVRGLRGEPLRSRVN